MKMDGLVSFRKERERERREVTGCKIPGDGSDGRPAALRLEEYQYCWNTCVNQIQFVFVKAPAKEKRREEKRGSVEDELQS